MKKNWRDGPGFSVRVKSFKRGYRSSARKLNSRTMLVGQQDKRCILAVPQHKPLWNESLKKGFWLYFVRDSLFTFGTHH